MMTATPTFNRIDYYRILQVEPSAEPAAIEQAFRDLRAARAAEEPGDEEIERAYLVLSDPERRRAYDQQRRQWLLEKVRAIREAARVRESHVASWGATLGCPILREALALAADERQGRVLAIAANERIQWVFTGLESPTAASWVDQDHILVCETGRDRVLLLAPVARQVVRTIGGLRHQGQDALPLKGSREALWLPTGTVLITDTLNHRVVEVNEDDEIVWQYGNLANKPDSPGGRGGGELCSPLAALRLEDGSTLITDAGNGRVVEMTPGGEIAWEYSPPRLAGQDPPPAWINFAVRLASGSMLLASDRLQEVDRGGAVLWEYTPAATDIGRVYPLVSGELLMDVTRVDGEGLSKALLAVNRGGEIVWEQEYSRLKAAIPPSS